MAGSLVNDNVNAELELCFGFCTERVREQGKRQGWTGKAERLEYIAFFSMTA